MFRKNNSDSLKTKAANNLSPRHVVTVPQIVTLHVYVLALWRRHQ